MPPTRPIKVKLTPTEEALLSGFAVYGEKRAPAMARALVEAVAAREMSEEPVAWRLIVRRLDVWPETTIGVFTLGRAYERAAWYKAKGWGTMIEKIDNQKEPT